MSKWIRAEPESGTNGKTRYINMSHVYSVTFMEDGRARLVGRGTAYALNAAEVLAIIDPKSEAEAATPARSPLPEADPDAPFWQRQ